MNNITTALIIILLVLISVSIFLDVKERKQKPLLHFENGAIVNLAENPITDNDSINNYLQTKGNLFVDISRTEIRLFEDHSHFVEIHTSPEPKSMHDAIGYLVVSVSQDLSKKYRFNFGDINCNRSLRDFELTNKMISDSLTYYKQQKTGLKAINASTGEESDWNDFENSIIEMAEKKQKRYENE